MLGIEIVDPSLPVVLVIAGPTASGKTSLALNIAERLPSEIVSADSRQVYTLLDIGTAKPTEEELNRVPHHCINIKEPDEKFNAGDFQEIGRKSIAGIVERKKLPIVVGGTGLYLRALIDGFFEQPQISGEVREGLEMRMKKEGKEMLYSELLSVDPAAASTMDASKYRRVIRALEIYYETGIPISQFHSQHTPAVFYNTIFVALNWERQALYERINRRVDRMIDGGLLEEVKRIQTLGFDDRFQSLQTVGYKEAFSFLRSEISHEEMVALIKQNTRRFAKRQLTWFRKEKRTQWVDIASETMIDDVRSQVAVLLAPYLQS
ncbi:MAG: tRNA (adenosine(37)-N6)-dimethylallyltransferase MiaA [Bacteroidota bacterium]|jgi:tRNA dimethylallyltransferase